MSELHLPSSARGPRQIVLQGIIALALLAGDCPATAEEAYRAAPAEARADRVLADFEQPDFDGWKIEGGAFGKGPTRKEDSFMTGIGGNGYATSARSDPQATGFLTSSPFVIDRDYLNFMIGGDRKGGSSLRLKIDGATAENIPALTRDGLYPCSIDLRPYAGRTATLEIRDTASDPKTDRFIAVDEIVLSDRSTLETVEANLVAAEEFLLLPLSKSGRPAILTVFAGEETVSRGEILLTTGKPDYWLPLAVGYWKGKKFRLVVEDAPLGTKFAEGVKTAAIPENAASLYNEKLRPQFHFSPQSGWLNDPNGLIYHEGEWHLFFQYNALGLDIGNQSWGHAVSKDLMHWKELTPALTPYVFSKGKSYSGSAVVDLQNRSGLGTEENPPFVAVYTDTGYEPRSECVAFSTDKGRTFTYFKGNPVYRHTENGRDPKVFWYPIEDTQQKNGHWVMVVYSKRDGKDGLTILVSDDLKSWRQTDWEPSHYECPELFQLPVQNVPSHATPQTKWVIQGGSAQYVLGDFDGKTFKPLDGQKHQTVHLPAYAGQCFNDAPGGRVIQMSWIRRHMNWNDMPFSQMMSVPLELSLRQTPQGVRLFAEPVKELAALRGRKFVQENFEIKPGIPFAIPLAGQLYDLEVTFTCPPDANLKVKLGDDEVTCWGDGTIEDLSSGNRPDTVTVRILVDLPLIEIIGNRGSFYLPKPRKDAGRDFTIELLAGPKPVRIETLKAYEMQSIWKSRP